MAVFVTRVGTGRVFLKSPLVMVAMVTRVLPARSLGLLEVATGDGGLGHDTLSPGKCFGSKGKEYLKRTASETQSHIHLSRIMIRTRSKFNL